MLDLSQPLIQEGQTARVSNPCASEASGRRRVKAALSTVGVLINGIGFGVYDTTSITKNLPKTVLATIKGPYIKSVWRAQLCISTLQLLLQHASGEISHTRMPSNLGIKKAPFLVLGNITRNLGLQKGKRAYWAQRTYRKPSFLTEGHAGRHGMTLIFNSNCHHLQQRRNHTIT